MLEAAIFHNSAYRGKNLTDIYSIDEMCRRISNGTFTDLFIGDYFDIFISTQYTSNEIVRCIFAGFDLFYNKGDIPLQQHHAIILPLNSFTQTFPLYLTDNIENGFLGSYLYQEILPVYTSALEKVFRQHLIEYRGLLSKRKSGPPRIENRILDFRDVWEWTNIKLNLMEEIELNGFATKSNIYDVFYTDFQFPLFKFNPSLKIAGLGGIETNKKNYRLRGFYGNDAGKMYDGRGFLSAQCASTPIGLRPYWLIG